jgi:hypothetical protein
LQERLAGGLLNRRLAEEACRRLAGMLRACRRLAGMLRTNDFYKEKYSTTA